MTINTKVMAQCLSKAAKNTAYVVANTVAGLTVPGWAYKVTKDVIEEETEEGSRERKLQKWSMLPGAVSIELIKTAAYIDLAKQYLS